MKKNQMGKNSQAGFSLIELAVVLVIMGILIGGVLKGRELIESARLRRVAAQINEIRLALHSFADKYNALPGDFEEAAGMIAERLPNGNGNGVVEGSGLAQGTEAMGFWAHLAGAGLIIDPGTKGVPEAAIGGGYFTVEQNPRNLQGLWIILGAKNQDHGDGGLLTPAQAMVLDKKLDNGQPTSGNIRGMDGSDQEPHACVREDGTYNVANKKPACALFFQP